MTLKLERNQISVFLIDSTRLKKRVLKKIKMDVMNQRFCQKKLRTAKRPNGKNAVLGKTFGLHHSFLCAGGDENSDTCTGDGGSPLACALKDTENKEKQYVQVNIEENVETLKEK